MEICSETYLLNRSFYKINLTKVRRLLNDKTRKQKHLEIKLKERDERSREDALSLAHRNRQYTVKRQQGVERERAFVGEVRKGYGRHQDPLKAYQNILPSMT